MTLMTLPDFLDRQLATHAISLGCSLTVTRSVPSLLNESCTPPSNVFPTTPRLHVDRLPQHYLVLCRSLPRRGLSPGHGTRYAGGSFILVLHGGLLARRASWWLLDPLIIRYG